MENNNDLKWVPCNTAVSKTEACFFEIVASNERRRLDDTARVAREGGQSGTSACIVHMTGVEASDTLPVIQIE